MTAQDAEIQLRTSVAKVSEQLVAQPMEVVRNIAELLTALAVDWHVPGHRRTLCAWPGKSFVRASTGDIPVDSGPYSLNGFIRFETQYMFPGMFETESSEDGEFRSASLTARGVEFAELGVLDYHRWGKEVRSCAFFCPPTSEIHQDQRLSARLNQLGITKDTK